MPFTDGQLNDRFERMVRHLDHWGLVEARDRGQARRRRILEFQLDLPGRNLPPDVRAVFREYFERDCRGAWELVKYTYEYADPVLSWRLAFHVHAIGGATRVAHAHCEPGTDLGGDESPRHFRATEYDLREANAIFMGLYAAGRAPDCGELLPLEVDRS